MKSKTNSVEFIAAGETRSARRERRRWLKGTDDGGTI